MNPREKTRGGLAALAEFGYGVADLTEKILLTKKVLFRQYIQETDIHPEAAGVTFEQVWKNKVRKRLGATMTNFASLDDLIKMKRAANRAKDREDLKVLRELKRRKRARQ